MLHLSSEDLEAAEAVLGTLDLQVAKLSATSQTVEIWEAWAARIRPTVTEQLTFADMN